jgi:hypothetical protein
VAPLSAAAGRDLTRLSGRLLVGSRSSFAKPVQIQGAAPNENQRRGKDEERYIRVDVSKDHSDAYLNDAAAGNGHRAFVKWLAQTPVTASSSSKRASSERVTRAERSTKRLTPGGQIMQATAFNRSANAL